MAVESESVLPSSVHRRQAAHYQRAGGLRGNSQRKIFKVSQGTTSAIFELGVAILKAYRSQAGNVNERNRPALRMWQHIPSICKWSCCDMVLWVFSYSFISVSVEIRKIDKNGRCNLLLSPTGRCFLESPLVDWMIKSLTQKVKCLNNPIYKIISRLLMIPKIMQMLCKELCWTVEGETAPTVYIFSLDARIFSSMFCL